MSSIQDYIISRNEDSALIKLKIESYVDSEQKTKNDPFDFVAFYNPTTFQASYTLKYAEDTTLGGHKREMRYNGYDAASYSFELMLDGTGSSVPIENTGAPKTVPSVDLMVKRFMAVAYGYVGDSHRASYLTITWGAMSKTRCVLNSANITYDLFHPSGDPLRAKIACQFKEYTYEEIKKAEAGNQSPDVTHVRVVQQGDRLPLMCERIYGDAKLYLEVARYNNLSNYRNLVPGQKIYFPPLVPTKS